MGICNFERSKNNKIKNDSLIKENNQLKEELIEVQKKKNEIEDQLNHLNRIIKSLEVSDGRIKIDFNRKIDIKEPEIIFDKKWTLKYKDFSTLDSVLQYCMGKTLIHEGYFSYKSDDNLELPFRKLKETGFELLKRSFNKIINDGFKTVCEQKFQELFNQNVTVINTLSDKLISANAVTAKNIYIKKYERQINYIKINKNINEIKYFTVLVIGKSGVGKSCLINNILELRMPEEGKEKKAGIDGAIEKKGGFITKINEAYISNKIKGIRCIDTPGCDLNGHDVQHTINECQKEINKQYYGENGIKKDPSDYVVIIWYCFSGNRFDDESDVQLIKKIRETYKENQIPVIIVRTEAYDDNDTDEFNKIIKELKLDADYIGVIAKEKFGKQRKNLNTLVELSITNIQKSLNGEFYKVLSKEIRENLIITLKNENEKISQFTKEHMILYFKDNYYETLGDNIEKDNYNCDLIKFIDDLLIICLSFYFVEFKNDKNLNESIKIFNELIINNFLRKAIEEYKNLSTKKVKEILFEKSLLLLDLQVKIQKDSKSNIKTENLCSITDLSANTIKFLCDNLFNVAQKIVIEIILKQVLFPLCENLKNKYNKDVNELVKDHKVEKLIQETYIQKFEELKEKIVRQQRRKSIYDPAPNPVS